MLLPLNPEQTQYPLIMGGYNIENHGPLLIVTLDSRSNIGNCKANEQTGESKSYNHASIKLLQLNMSTGMHWLMIQFGQTHKNKSVFDNWTANNPK